nr:aldose 1-epimerase family protein [Kibdelosporangium sp. MJ126-NF4]CEL13631.1 putative aldose-1-epimerase [Kibdelosporangium sp. MJ126-NF4]CTQ99317.1 putative aldose-1-epimerase [Kibdelosporangium sp. MJ126-NF4]
MPQISRRGVLAAAAAVPLALPDTANARDVIAPSGRQFPLSSGNHKLVVTEVGAALRSWQVDGRELLLTHPADQLGDSFFGKVLLPWANRIDSATYTFRGTEYQTPASENWSGHAIHGLVSWAAWTPVRHDKDRVTLEYTLHPQYGYPFALRFQLEYALRPHGVQVMLTARNVGTTVAPLGAGYHPYFRVDVNAARLTVPAETYLVNNDMLIPVGRSGVDGTPYDFRATRQVGATKLDTCFTDLRREDGIATVSVDQIRLWMDGTHEFVQVYTDDGAPGRPARAGISIEPMTSAPNAFNSGDGLITLEPGQSHRGSWGLSG